MVCPATMDKKNKSRRCFGGNANNLGVVRRLGGTSFREFVKNYLFLPTTINVTRDRYAAMERDEQNRVKRVPFVTPCAFKQMEEGPVARRMENAGKVALICLDL